MIKHIIPIGADCYSALILEEMNLRKISLPFDYIYSDIKMIKDCLNNDFVEFLNKNNYKDHGSKGCVNKFYKKKFPHFRLTEDKLNQKMYERKEKFKNILKSNENKLFVHVIALYNQEYLDNLLDFLNNITTNFNLLFIWKKRSQINSLELKLNVDNIYVYKICTKTKSIDNKFLKEIFSKYNFNLDYTNINNIKINYNLNSLDNNNLKLIKNNNLNKRLVVYCYCELGRFPELRKKNLEFFLKCGLIESNDIDFYIIINGHTVSVDIPKKDNLKIKYRDNVSFDFGAYSEIILNEDMSNYNYFIFLNDSVRGPYLFDWFPKNYNWTDLFIQKLSDNVKLVGTTINYYKGNPHINSQLFCTDVDGLNLLIKEGIISEKLIKKKPVYSKELKMSKIMLDNNYNIACMLEVYKNLDFRKFRGEKYKDDGNLNANFKGSRDPQYKRRFFGMSLNPFETIFFKSNRDIDNRKMDKYSEWIMNGNKLLNTF